MSCPDPQLTSVQYINTQGALMYGMGANEPTYVMHPGPRMATPLINTHTLKLALLCQDIHAQLINSIIKLSVAGLENS